jgi:hypothetical protein
MWWPCDEDISPAIDDSSDTAAGWWDVAVTISTSSALRFELVIASAEASSAAGMWSSVKTWLGICAGESSFCRVDMGTGSWTLRSKISLEAGLCMRGELDRILEGEAAAIELLYCCFGGETGIDCEAKDRLFTAGFSLRGEAGRAPGIAADVSDMMVEDVSRVESLWPRRSWYCAAFCVAEPVSLRLPVTGSMYPASSSTVRSWSSCRWSAGMSGAAEV